MDRFDFMDCPTLFLAKNHIIYDEIMDARGERGVERVEIQFQFLINKIHIDAFSINRFYFYWKIKSHISRLQSSIIALNWIFRQKRAFINSTIGHSFDESFKLKHCPHIYDSFLDMCAIKIFHFQYHFHISSQTHSHSMEMNKNPIGNKKSFMDEKISMTIEAAKRLKIAEKRHRKDIRRLWICTASFFILSAIKCIFSLILSNIQN